MKKEKYLTIPKDVTIFDFLAEYCRKEQTIGAKIYLDEVFIDELEEQTARYTAGDWVWYHFVKDDSHDDRPWLKSTSSMIAISRDSVAVGVLLASTNVVEVAFSENLHYKKPENPAFSVFLKREM